MTPFETAREPSPRARAADVGVAPRLTTPRVLVVDDDELGRDAVAGVLRARGFAVATAADGDEALAEIARLAPDLVLTDLHMPGLDGAALCRHLHDDHQDLPVIVMTATADIGSVVECMRGGAEDYLTKPLQRDAILWSVERALSRKAARRERLAILRDLNERLLLSSLREQELADLAAVQRQQIAALLANLTEGVIVAEPGGALMIVNDTARAILDVVIEPVGCEAEVHRLVMLDRAGAPLSADRRPLARALAGEQFTDDEVSVTRPHGGTRRLVFTGTSVRDDEGRVALAIVVFRDVTELKAVEQRRDELLALVSHDLRNPLAVVLMALSLLGDRRPGDALPGPTDAQRADLLSRAGRNARRMLAMLEELSVIGPLEANTAFALTRCDLREIVSQAIDAVDEPQRRITVEAASESPLSVLAEAAQLARVVANLLTNALKYSGAEAPVVLRLVRRADEAVLEVSDQGIGIAPEDLQRLFERYYRAPGGQASAKGLGLGLYIARLIVEGHRGRLEVTSKIGAGTTFTLSLPLAVD